MASAIWPCGLPHCAPHQKHNKQMVRESALYGTQQIEQSDSRTVGHGNLNREQRTVRQAQNSEEEKKTRGGGEARCITCSRQRAACRRPTHCRSATVQAHRASERQSAALRENERVRRCIPCGGRWGRADQWTCKCEALQTNSPDPPNTLRHQNIKPQRTTAPHTGKHTDGEVSVNQDKEGQRGERAPSVRTEAIVVAGGRQVQAGSGMHSCTAHKKHGHSHHDRSTHHLRRRKGEHISSALRYRG
jgi:hypothetical protein